MKVLIVDDEAFVRVSFKSYIDWNRYGFELIGEAEDGESALEMIQNLMPDIVFLDINIPKLDGIEVLKKMKKMNLTSKVIILSGYNEFEYVKEAMKAGALDYIHKPGMNMENLLLALSNARMIIDSEKIRINEYKDLKTNLEQNKGYIKSNFFKDVIEGKISSTWELEQKMKLLNIKLENANIVCFIISIDNYLKVQERYKKERQNLLDFAINNIIEELFKEEGFEFLRFSENVYLIIKSYKTAISVKDSNDNNDLIIRTLREALRQFLNVKITVGVSKIHPGIISLPNAFDEALSANKYKFFTGDSKTIQFNELHNKIISLKHQGDAEEFVFKKLLNDIKTDLGLNNITVAASIIEKFFTDIFEAKDTFCYSIHSIVNFSILLFSLIDEKLRAIQPKRTSDETEEFSVYNLYHAENINEIKSFLLRMLENLFVIIMNQQNITSTNSKIKSALHYIHLNFTKDITLEEVAAEVDLNSSYFSRLFKDETGMTFVIYVNKCRIDKAINYIKNTGLKNYEISELVGYNNVEYFNTMFKKMLGMTPTEYKSTR
jgi:two-component system, response regulator YesN